jgi:hypothetical protein
MKLRDRTYANECHENIRRFRTHSPHELVTKQCTRKRQYNNWNRYETMSSQQVFFRRRLSCTPWTDNRFSFHKTLSRNCSCFLIHTKYTYFTCSILIWHNIAYRPISWSINQQDICEKNLRGYLCLFYGTSGLSKYESWCTYDLSSRIRFSSFSLSSRKGWDGFQIPCCRCVHVKQSSAVNWSKWNP